MTRLMQIAPAIIMAALSALVIFETRHLTYWSDYSPGPAFAPWWIAVCGLVLSALLAVHTLRSASVEPWEGTGTTSAGFLRAAATFGALIAFIGLTPYLGFVVTSMLVASTIMLVILRRALAPSLASTAVAGALIYGIFVWWLQIPLPKGPLGF
jgi:putative tricarboxylic transport membrane protein